MDHFCHNHLILIFSSPGFHHLNVANLAFLQGLPTRNARLKKQSIYFYFKFNQLQTSSSWRDLLPDVNSDVLSALLVLL